jgi:hypothetical protein
VTTSDGAAKTRGRGVTPPESLLDLIRARGTATRAELVDETSWGRTVLAQRLEELMEIGLVSDAGTGRSTGGRAPREVRFRREAAAVTGVNLGATSIEMAVTDLTGEPLATYEEDWDIARGPEETLDRVETLVEQIVADSPVSPTDIVGLGVGLPGPVEFASGRTISPPIMPGWSNFPVRDRLAGRFGVHVVVDNDVNTKWFVTVSTTPCLGAEVMAKGTARRSKSSSVSWRPARPFFTVSPLLQTGYKTMN